MTIISIIHIEAEFQWFPPSPQDQPLTLSNGPPDFVKSHAWEPFNPDLGIWNAFDVGEVWLPSLGYMDARFLHLLDFFTTSTLLCQCAP